MNCSGYSSGFWKTPATSSFTQQCIFPPEAYYLFISFVLLSPRVQHLDEDRKDKVWVDRHKVFMYARLSDHKKKKKKGLLINGTSETSIRHNSAS